MLTHTPSAMRLTRRRNSLQCVIGAVNPHLSSRSRRSNNYVLDFEGFHVNMNGKKTKAGISNGDSGGPLLVYKGAANRVTNSEKATVLGVLSYGASSTL